MPRSITRGSFTIVRHLKHAAARVFDAFAKEDAKAKWFAGPPGWEPHEKISDCEGGRGFLKGRHGNGMVSAFDCVYRDIVAAGSREHGANFLMDQLEKR